MYKWYRNFDGSIDWVEVFVRFFIAFVILGLIVPGVITVWVILFKLLGGE